MADERKQRIFVTDPEVAVRVVFAVVLFNRLGNGDVLRGHTVHVALLYALQRNLPAFGPGTVLGQGLLAGFQLFLLEIHEPDEAGGFLGALFRSLFMVPHTGQDFQRAFPGFDPGHGVGQRIDV